MIDRKLTIFRTAAALRNFTETAAALGMTQPNVTHQLARLEEELGVRLFLRDGRRVVLTAAGKALEAECGQLFADSARIVRSVQCAAAEMKVFHIGGTLTAGGYLLPDLAGSYMKRHPDRILELKVANTNGIEEMISARKLDVALVEGPFEQKYFLSEPFIPDELLPAFAPGHCAEASSLEEYIRCGGRLILRGRGSGTRYYFDRFLQTRKLPEPPPRNILEVNSFDALKRFVRQGLGITVISKLAIGDELAAGTLATGRFTEGEIVRRMNFIYLPGGELKFAETFIAYCKANTPAHA